MEIDFNSNTRKKRTYSVVIDIMCYIILFQLVLSDPNPIKKNTSKIIKSEKI